MKNSLLLCFLLGSLLSCFDAQETKEKVASEQISVDSLQPLSDRQLDSLNNAIRQDINNADLYIARSLYFENQGQIAEAKNDLDRAYLIDTTAVKPLIAYADYWIKRGKLGFALDVLERASRHHSNSADVYVKLSELYLVARNNVKSLEYADRAIKHDMFNAKAYYLKGFNFIEIGDTTKAISSYQTAVEQNPEYFEAYLELGVLYAELNNDLAIQYYDNALSIRPNERNVLYSKGMYYQEHEMYNEAMKTYHEAIKRFPDFREAHYNMGYVHMYYLQLYKEAIRYFTDAIKVDPNYYQAYYNRGYSFELLGDVNNALKDYEYALKIKPDYTIAAEGMSRVNRPIEQ